MTRRGQCAPLAQRSASRGQKGGRATERRGRARGDGMRCKRGARGRRGCSACWLRGGRRRPATRGGAPRAARSAAGSPRRGNSMPVPACRAAAVPERAGGARVVREHLRNPRLATARRLLMLWRAAAAADGRSGRAAAPAGLFCGAKRLAAGRRGRACPRGARGQCLACGRLWQAGARTQVLARPCVARGHAPPRTLPADRCSAALSHAPARLPRRRVA